MPCHFKMRTCVKKVVMVRCLSFEMGIFVSFSLISLLNAFRPRITSSWVGVYKIIKFSLVFFFLSYHWVTFFVWCLRFIVFKLNSLDLTMCVIYYFIVYVHYIDGVKCILLFINFISNDWPSVTYIVELCDKWFDWKWDKMETKSIRASKHWASNCR